ncbi:BUD13 homolog [Xenentodon cancila]
MASSTSSIKPMEVSKAEYLKRYLSADEDGRKSKEKVKKKRRKAPGRGLKIVDDDIDWRHMVKEQMELDEEEDEAPVIAEVIDERPEEVKQMEVFRTGNRWKAFGADEDDDKEDNIEKEHTEPVASSRSRHDSPELSSKGEKHKSSIRKTVHDSPGVSSPRRRRHDSPDASPRRRGRHDPPDASPPRRGHHDSPDASPPRRARHDSPDASPPRRARHDSPGASPSRRARHDSPDAPPPRRGRHDSPDAPSHRWGRHDTPDTCPPRRGQHDSPDVSPPRRRRHDSLDLPFQQRGHHDTADLLHPKQHSGKTSKMHSKDAFSTRRKPDSTLPSKKGSPDLRRSPLAKKPQHRHDSDDSDQSPPRKKSLKCEALDSDQSPPRRRSKTKRDSDSDLSPVRRRPQNQKDSDGDLSPPRRTGQSQAQRMLSGGKSGLVSVDVLKKEQEENRRRERNNQPLEDEARNAQTVFRDKSGKRRDLESEREEQRQKAGEKAAKDEKYAQWGKGLAQSQMHQQKLEDALHEAQKPLARHYDDEDLDRMLREQEREGDPMAAMLRRKKNRTTKTQEKPCYKGPTPPPNRFNIMPGYRWDGVDRSNGFEQKRYTRLADKKALQEEAYKWSVEDM